MHGTVVLWDAHSTRSVLPRFFEGRLTDLKLGTGGGTSCDPALAAELLRIASSASGHTAVLNGRFKGGHITRTYGNPAGGVHAVQLEMTQASYMEEQLPFAYLAETAIRVRSCPRLAWNSDRHPSQGYAGRRADWANLAEGGGLEMEER